MPDLIQFGKATVRQHEGENIAGVMAQLEAPSVRGHRVHIQVLTEAHQPSRGVKRLFSWGVTSCIARGNTGVPTVAITWHSENKRVGMLTRSLIKHTVHDHG